MNKGGALRLESSTGDPPLESLEAINDAIKGLGAHIWPLEFGDLPPEIRRLLDQLTLSPAENEQLKSHFMFSRERLLEIIADAGREPHVPGGGALVTHVVSHNYDYPQLYVAESGVDYSRFDRFHVNVADDGSGVDEIMQLLTGGPIIIHLRLPNEDVLRITLHCESEDRGWLVTYDGDKPHIGSLTQAEPGTKALVQVIGTPRWSITYSE